MRLSIVVAVQDGGHRLPALLDGLGAQRVEGVEVLLVHSDGDAPSTQAIAAEARPWARVVTGPRAALIPTLWSAGIAEARAPRVALTVVHAQPGPRWVQGLLAADLSTFAGVGGPIAQGDGEDAVSWAIYLQRYAPFAPSEDGPSAAEQIPGDNAVYDRDALLAVRDSWRDGFWELDVHRALAERGGGLALDPSLTVEHRNGSSARAFAAQRLRHGYEFGRGRSRRLHPLGRAAYRSLTPTIPLLFGRKLALRALRCEPARSHLTEAAPWLVLFLGAWSLGEALGALTPVSAA